MDFSIDLTAIILFLLTALGGTITAYVIPWLKSKTTMQQREFLNIVLDTAVKAAEQLYKSGEGQAKKEFVIQYLKDRHVVFNEHQIEAKVKELFGKPGSLLTQPVDATASTLVLEGQTTFNTEDLSK